MPTYNFRNDRDDHEFEKVMRISELDQFKTDNPTCVQIHKVCNGLNYTARTKHSIKNDDGWKEVLGKIKSAHPLGTIDTM